MKSLPLPPQPPLQTKWDSQKVDLKSFLRASSFSLSSSTARGFVAIFMG
jgi:hypothetical protein